MSDFGSPITNAKYGAPSLWRHGDRTKVCWVLSSTKLAQSLVQIYKIAFVADRLCCARLDSTQFGKIIPVEYLYGIIGPELSLLSDEKPHSLSSGSLGPDKPSSQSVPQHASILGKNWRTDREPGRYISKLYFLPLNEALHSLTLTATRRCRVIITWWVYAVTAYITLWHICSHQVQWFDDSLSCIMVVLRLTACLQ